MERSPNTLTAALLVLCTLPAVADAQCGARDCCRQGSVQPPQVIVHIEQRPALPWWKECFRCEAPPRAEVIESVAVRRTTPEISRAELVVAREQLRLVPATGQVEVTRIRDTGRLEELLRERDSEGRRKERAEDLQEGESTPVDDCRTPRTSDSGLEHRVQRLEERLDRTIGALDKLLNRLESND